ncbi:flagellar hook-length control protein FliK [Citrobacter freundii]|uniref:flagellar hook-length control protein FliK n=1 Tax=Citrobacter freundii TaxID=546 RepID=UPI0025C91D53|nr:flagellar hook-length control protein FliK [Citrobacter freundii]ELK6346644.1 flagellar hook-length control protein FliK [Citrobacter freundii]ELK6347342.1 flagellar hook-length control protein FliK [Citrobacter freundii]MDN4197012.1 flagellar hook-length control protein FliK [Citrobacter freundii]MDN4227487.1 flagellar hook-length control protein FliK [Citrobacter freundii]MEB6428093.1 flagellar hook-length control protein FliK [Citrobacter freundii]
MNPVLLASASASAEASPEKATVSASAAPASRGTFSLPQSGLNATAERLIGAKLSHQQTSAAAHKPDDANPAAMQALLAMLLAQPTQAAPADVQKQPDGDMLRMLAQVQTTHSGSSLLRQLASAMAQPEKTSTPSAEQHTTDLSSLPPKLQTLLASLSEDLPPATPEQQAKLSTFSAQDLRAIAPEPASLSTTQQISARVKATQNASPRPVVERKNAGVTVNPALSTQSLLNTAAQGNQPVNALSDHNIVSTQVSAPVTVSSEELGEKLTALLKDRIQFQLGQQQQVSTIRLDPPSLGKLEIAVQLDAGKLMVHIGANQSDVCRSLQQFSENLRQHLTAQNFMEVNVQVSSEGQSQQQQQQQSGHQQDEVTSALVLNDEPQFQRNESVLIKV